MTTNPTREAAEVTAADRKAAEAWIKEYTAQCIASATDDRAQRVQGTDLLARHFAKHREAERLSIIEKAKLAAAGFESKAAASSWYAKETFAQCAEVLRDFAAELQPPTTEQPKGDER